ncbi:MAG: hypothetical protein L6R42_009837, partial [Xanthoria sp. 1 TBL-2021]
MVFEGLAFKSDISHWRNKKDNVGISFRTILANVFMQTVIFLYLLDNSDGTSWMILFGQGMGILLEAWKITKTVDVRIREASPNSWLPYKVTFEDKHKLSETEEKTKEYDQIAFRYLYMVAVPLLGAYAVYSLLYETHKSWYSFVITTLVGSVYAYGFLMMVPSLYINYRLKSVAHMPAKAMTYKFLNTFIDDLFAFTIKMPTLHRLATLRDDVIFFVYIYQAWAYKVDYTRVNEFGQGGDDEPVEDKLANKPLSAAPDGEVAATKVPPEDSDESQDARDAEWEKFFASIPLSLKMGLPTTSPFKENEEAKTAHGSDIKSAETPTASLKDDTKNPTRKQKTFKHRMRRLLSTATVRPFCGDPLLLSSAHRRRRVLLGTSPNATPKEGLALLTLQYQFMQFDSIYMRARVETMEIVVKIYRARVIHQYGLCNFHEHNVKEKHIAEIEKQKGKIRKLARSLQILQSQHFDQHADKTKEKRDAIASTYMPQSSSSTGSAKHEEYELNDFEQSMESAPRFSALVSET